MPFCEEMVFRVLEAAKGLRRQEAPIHEVHGRLLNLFWPRVYGPTMPKDVSFPGRP